MKSVIPATTDPLLTTAHAVINRFNLFASAIRENFETPSTIEKVVGDVGDLSDLLSKNGMDNYSRSLNEVNLRKFSEFSVFICTCNCCQLYFYYIFFFVAIHIFICTCNLFFIAIHILICACNNTFIAILISFNFC